MPAIKEVVVDNLGNTTIEFSDDSTTAYNQFEKLTDIETRVADLEAAGPGGSGVSNGDKGDITVTNTGSTWTIDNDVVTNAKLANMASGTMKGRVTTGTGDPEDLSATQVRSFLNVADGATANSPDASLLARANHTGTQTSSTISDLAEAIDDRLNALLVAGTNITLAYNDVANTLTINAAGSSGVADGDKGDIIVSAGGTSWVIDSAVVTDAKISNRAAFSVFGRSANSTGVGADITAGTDGHVLRRSGTTLGFGQLATAAFANNTIPLAAIANITAQSVLVNATGSAAAPTALTLGASQLVGRGSTGNVAVITLGTNLSMTGTTLNASGGVSDGDKGDITVSGSGATWTVDAGLDAAKIANGTVSNAEFETLNGVTSNIQTQLDSKLDADLATDLVAGTDIAEADSVVFNDVSDTNTPKLGGIPALRQRLRTKPIGTSLGTTGTVNLDFTALHATEQRITMTGDITFTTSNITAGANFDVRVAAGASSRNLAYPSGWTSFGVALPTTIAAGKVVRFTFSSGGTANADVDVAAVVSV